LGVQPVPRYTPVLPLSSPVAGSIFRPANHTKPSINGARPDTIFFSMPSTMTLPVVEERRYDYRGFLSITYVTTT
jgi:hypothetical protein